MKYIWICWWHVDKVLLNASEIIIWEGSPHTSGEKTLLVNSGGTRKLIMCEPINSKWKTFDSLDKGYHTEGQRFVVLVELSTDVTFVSCALCKTHIVWLQE